MKGIIWLWNHRRKRIYRRSELPGPKEGERNPYLTEDGQLRRPFKVPPAPPLPCSDMRIEKAMVFPITDETNPFEERLDPMKEKSMQSWSELLSSKRPNSLAWLKEKQELLSTHLGWLVAYQDGKRVALEPDCDKMLKAVDVELGEHRRQVEIHEVVDEPVVYSGPSPRHKPMSNAELRITEQNCRIGNAHCGEEFMRDSLAMLKDKR